jgi:GGDEF domain-containing protein
LRAVPPACSDRIDLAPEQACLTSGVSVVVVDVEPLATGIDTVVDQVLTALGRRLAGLVRPTDLVVRPWRTRFVLVLDGARDDYQLAGARRRITDALTPPVLMDGRPLRTSVLVGVVVSDPQDTVDAVLARLGSVATRRPVRVRRAIGVVVPPA